MRYSVNRVAHWHVGDSVKQTHLRLVTGFRSWYETASAARAIVDNQMAIEHDNAILEGKLSRRHLPKPNIVSTLFERFRFRDAKRETAKQLRVGRLSDEN